MENYFERLPRNLRSKNSVLVPLLAIGISLIGLFSVVSFISGNYDIRNFAAGPNLGHMPSDCYYVRRDCTGQAAGSCRPILVCPTNTPTPSLTMTPSPIPTYTPARVNCNICLQEGASSLCLNLKDKVSSCSATLENTYTPDKVCAPCKEMPTPTAIPTVPPTATPIPSSTPTAAPIPTATSVPPSLTPAN